MIAARDSWLTELPGVRAYHVNDDAERDEARRMQAGIYAAAGPYPLGSHGMVDDAWVDVATYFVVRGPDHELLGTCRLIPMTNRSLPTLESDRVSPEWKRHFLRRDHRELGEVASLAMASGRFPSPNVSAALYRAVFHYTMGSTDQVTWVLTMDRLLNRFTYRYLGVPSTAIGDTSLVRGRKTRAYSVHATEYLRRAREIKSDFWRYLCQDMVIDLDAPQQRADALDHSHLRA